MRNFSFPQNTWFLMKLIGSLKWDSENSWTKHYTVFLIQSKWFCLVQHYQKCWWILPRLALMIRCLFVLVGAFLYRHHNFLIFLLLEFFSWNCCKFWFFIFSFSHPDVDSKLPEKLNLKFVHIRPDERYSALLSILKYIVEEGSQTVVFVATQHHVELVSYVRIFIGFICIILQSNSQISFQLIQFISNIPHGSGVIPSKNLEHIYLFEYGSIGTKN